MCVWVCVRTVCVRSCIRQDNSLIQSEWLEYVWNKYLKCVNYCVLKKFVSQKRAIRQKNTTLTEGWNSNVSQHERKFQINQVSLTFLISIFFSCYILFLPFSLLNQRATSCRLLLESLHYLTDIQPMSRQALFILHSDEECYSCLSVVHLRCWQLTQ